ncbi:YceI family protein [Occultella glacieicola]|uniref:YceI family protein n=1 Tax=Occultella glacieicola TaxID=2518684 RepID=A0ABY2E8V8_9MICO|nr:YceI family protein [Occultella glacieicola]TDE97418.1 YceI family protein [Occultella glacieicola]
MRARTIGVIVVAGVLVVGGVAFGPRLYADLANRSAAAPPELTSGSGSALDPAALAGDWTLGAGSYAGYRVHEVLQGNDANVVGRTETVEGTLTIAEGAVTAAEVIVDVESIATDQPPRDAYFRGTAMEVGTFPTATFTLTGAAQLPDGGTDVTLSGDLTVHGVTRPVQVDAAVAQSTDDAIQVVGAIPITFSDYGVGAPDLGFVVVDPDGEIEFSLVWEPATP